MFQAIISSTNLRSILSFDQSVPSRGGETPVGTKVFVISILAAISLSVLMKLMLCQW